MDLLPNSLPASAEAEHRAEQTETEEPRALGPESAAEQAADSPTAEEGGVDAGLPPRGAVPGTLDDVIASAEHAAEGGVGAEQQAADSPTAEKWREARKSVEAQRKRQLDKIYDGAAPKWYEWPSEQTSSSSTSTGAAGGGAHQSGRSAGSTAELSSDSPEGKPLGLRVFIYAVRK